MSSKQSGELNNRVTEFLGNSNLPVRVKVLAPESTRTSKAAAESLGCTVAEIAKTIAFVEETGSTPILVILSGDKRVSLSHLERDLAGTNGEVPKLRKMSAEQVKERTGYSIGGVPPFPHNEGISILVDESLFRFEKVWAAAGTPNSVMQLSPLLLREVMKYRVVNVAE